MRKRRKVIMVAWKLEVIWVMMKMIMVQMLAALLFSPLSCEVTNEERMLPIFAASMKSTPGNAFDDITRIRQSSWAESLGSNNIAAAVAGVADDDVDTTISTGWTTMTTLLLVRHEHWLIDLRSCDGSCPVNTAEPYTNYMITIDTMMVMVTIMMTR